MGHTHYGRIYIGTGIVDRVVVEDGVVPIVSELIAAVSYRAGVS